jgi:hypothetical protein
MVRLLLHLLFCVLFVAHAATGQTYGNEWINYNQKYYSFKVQTTGIHRIDHSMLVTSGIPVGTFSHENIQIFGREQEVPLFIELGPDGTFGPGDYIAFYAERNDGWLDTTLYEDPSWQGNPKYSLYNDTLHYFFTWNNSTTNKRFTVETDVNFSAFTPSTHILSESSAFYNNAYNEGEKTSNASSSFYMPGEGWGRSPVNGASNFTLPLSAPTPSVYTGSDAPLCRFKSVSVSNSNAAFTPGVGEQLGNHHLQFTIGTSDLVIVDTIFSGYKAINIDTYFPSSTLATGNTTLKWKIIGDQGAATDFQSLNYWSFFYPRIPNLGGSNKINFLVKNNLLESKIRLDVTNLVYSNPFVFVMGSTPRRVPLILNGSVYSALIPNDPSSDEQLVVYQDLSTLTTVGSLAPVNGNGFFNDYSIWNAEKALLMVYHTSLQQATFEYAAYRQSALGGNYNVIIANVNELYLQFGGGISKHISGIRRFAHFMYDQSSEKPVGLFLIGKGIREADVGGLTSTGPGSRKNVTNHANNLIPSFGQPSSDAFITSRLPGTTRWMPLIPTGRLAAISNQEVLDYLNKVKLYDGHQNQASVYNTPLKDWQKQILHFVGGSDQSQQITFQNYMNVMKNTIENRFFAGNVSTIAKSTSDPFTPSELQSVMQRIEDGVSLINYFGHAGATASGFEINLDDPNNWNNYGKYPVMLTNSCYNGNIFQSNRSKSEEFVNIPNYGAIAYIGTVNLGFANTLFQYSNELYKNFSLANYGKTLAEQMRSTIGAIETFGNNLLNESTATQMVLNGDPMVRLNWHEKPEIELTAQSISFLPENIDLTTDSIEMRIELKNLGRSILDTFSLEVRRNFPNSAVDSVYQFYISPLHYKKVHSFKMPLQANIGVGINSFTVKADIPSFVPEQYDELSNNQITRTLFINIAGIEPVLPWDYAVVPSDSVTLKASTINPIADFNTYRFEIDTTDLFNSPFKKHAVVSGLGGVKEVHPSQWLNSSGMSSPLICTDSTVYFWRVAIDETNPFWRERSFQYIPGKEGWGQDHFFQYKNNGFSALDYDRETRIKSFLPQSHLLTCDVKASSAIPDIYYNAHYIDGQQMEYGICTYTPAFHVAVIDPMTFESWGTRYGTENPDNNFGNDNDNGSCRNRVENHFIFRQSSLSQLSNFQNMVLNEVPDGHYLLIYTPITARFDLWDGIDPNIYSTFAALGSDSIYPGRPNRPFAFFCKKGDPTSVVEQIAQQPGEDVFLSAEMIGSDFRGFETSTLIGPAAEWDAVFWKQDPQEEPSSDTTILTIYGYTNAGVLGYTQSIEFSRNDSLLNLNGFVNAANYPYLKLRAAYKDSVTFTPAQMESWHVLYTPLPEAAIDGSTAYTWLPLTDTLTEGQSVSFAVDVRNIFNIPMDSLLVNYWVTDQNQLVHPIPYARQDSLRVGQVMRDTIDFSTAGLVGLNTFWMEVNPYLDASMLMKDQPEQAHFNNLLQIPFFVRGDSQNPILDVTFNGRHILNNDIIAPNSEILITLKDENQFLIMDADADTTFFGIYLTDPDGNQTRIPFMDGLGNMVMQWIPAEAQHKRFKIIYPAYFSKSGKYTLMVQGSDKSGNLSGDIEYRITFEVIHESMITHLMNYPNPFSTSTRFVFTVTGNEVPDDIIIQIMTVTGRVVREITEDQLGPIHIGRNMSEYAWDGKDEFGDPLANGVYLYRVKSRLNGEEIKHLETGADQYFKKGFGKMYLMR